VPAGNLTTNPSFETDTAGWSGYQATLARTALADAPNGGFAVKATRSGSTSYTVGNWPARVGAQAGARYTASGWVKAASASAQGKTVAIYLREYTAGGAFVRQTATTGRLGTSFVPLSVSATASASGNLLDVYIAQTGAVAGDALYADLVTLVSG
jgi:hypothetical protein